MNGDDEVSVSPCMRLGVTTLPARTADQGDLWLQVSRKFLREI